VNANIKATREATRITAAWSSCTGLKGRVTLRASIDAATCNTMRGRLRDKAARPKVAASFRATRSRCGDGIVDAGNNEQCDAGVGCAGGEVCNASCGCVAVTTTTTPTTIPECTTTTLFNAHCGPPPATCGNGHLDQGEECDDGPNNDGTHCSANCTIPVCGNCSVDPGEECDDGNNVPNDGCTDCMLDPVACNADGLDAHVCLTK